MAPVQGSIGHQESPLGFVCGGVVFPDSGSNAVLEGTDELSTSTLV